MKFLRNCIPAVIKKGSRQQQSLIEQKVRRYFSWTLVIVWRGIINNAACKGLQDNL